MSCIPIPDFFPAIAMTLFAGFIGFLFGRKRDVAAHKAILDKEADIRRRRFRRIITRGIYRVQHPPEGKPEDPFPVFQEAMTDISAEFEVCAVDFVNAAPIQEAIEAANMTTHRGLESMGRTQGMSRREIVVSKLHDILASTHNNA